LTWLRGRPLLLMFYTATWGAAHDVVVAGKKERCWTRYCWNWWSGLLAANVGCLAKRGAAGVVFFTRAGAKVVRVLGYCWSRCRG
jgi:hypothetical protein